MQAASDATDGSMVSVIGLTAEKVQNICDAAAKQSGEPVQVQDATSFALRSLPPYLASSCLALDAIVSTLCRLCWNTCLGLGYWVWVYRAARDVWVC